MEQKLKSLKIFKKLCIMLIVLGILFTINKCVYAAPELDESVVGKGQEHRDTFTIDDRPVYVYGTASERESGYIERTSTGTEDTYYSYHIYKATPKSGWKFVRWATHYYIGENDWGQNSEIGLSSKWYFSSPSSNTTKADAYSNTIRVNNGPDILDYSEWYRLYAIFSPIVTGTVDSHGQIKTRTTYPSYTNKIELPVPYQTNSETIYISIKDVGYEIDEIKINGTSQNISDSQRGEQFRYTFSNVTAPQTISATFRPVVYKIKYEGNTSTSGNMNVQEFSYGTEEALTANAFKKLGYEFDGWNTMADRTGTEYIDKQKINNLTTKSNQTITLYAQWKASNLTGNVDIIGEEKVNKTLEAKVTSTNNTGTLKYQWQNESGNIQGATENTYTLTTNDVNQKITCVVTSTVQTGSIKATTGNISDEYLVKYNLTNVATEGKNVAKIGEEYNTIILPDAKYKLPEQIIVTIADKELDLDKYSYDNTTGVLTIPANDIIGDIEITVEALKIPEYKITIKADNGVNVTSSDNLEEVLEGTAVTLKINAKSGYKLTYIKIDDVKQTLPLKDNVLIINDIKENVNITIKTERVQTNNPNTSDNLLFFITIFVLSVICIFVTVRLNKKENNR